MKVTNNQYQLDRCLSCREAAEFLGTSKKTLEFWRCMRKGPSYLKQGRSVRYRLRDLLAYQESNLVIPQ